MKYILAIDQGTTSTRAIVFDSKENIIKVAQKEIKNYFPKPSWVEQDANEIWSSVLSVIAEIFADGSIKPEDIEAIGISNQRETTIVWDKNTGTPIYKAIVWQSRQTNDLVEKYRSKGLDPIIKEKTGLLLDPYFSATKIRWILDNTDKNYDDLLFGTVDTWLLWKMTDGKVHATDVTNASRTLLFNINDLKFDDELLEIFGIPKTMMPDVKDTSGIFGYIEKKYFFDCSCPITCLVGDQQAALFGESCFEKGDVKNTYGTGGFMLVNTGDELVRSNYGLVSTVAWKIKDEIKYALEGSIFVSGSLMQWLRDGLNFFDDAAYSEEIAKSITSNEGVIIVPAFTGLGAPYWNQSCKGAIFGLTRGVDKRHIIRASLEAMAFQSKDLVNLINEDMKMNVKELKVDGGAANNNFLLQFQSDILEIPVIKLAISEATALGAARFAGLATGFFNYGDFKEDDKKVFNPSLPHNEVSLKYEAWQKAVAACMKF